MFNLFKKKTKVKERDYRVTLSTEDGIKINVVVTATDRKSALEQVDSVRVEGFAKVVDIGVA